MYIDIKNSAYKESRGVADWVIVCDIDEFLYHPQLIELLSVYTLTGVNLPRVEAYQMVPNTCISKVLNLVQTCNYGVRLPGYDKQLIFDPKLELLFEPGCHSYSCSGQTCVSEDVFKMLHYKMLNLDYYIRRTKILKSRLSELNIQKGQGVHYNASDTDIIQQYWNFYNSRVKVYD